MRKITKEAAKAFWAGKKFNRDNTRVNFGPVGIWIMFLHNNQIAWRYRDTELHISMCGWPTATTRERLDGVLQMSSYPCYICQRKWKQIFVNRDTGQSVELDPNETYDVSTLYIQTGGK